SFLVLKMKNLILIAFALMVFSCTPDQKLVEENERLIAQVEEMRKRAEALQQEALMAATAAREAQAEAEKQVMRAEEAAAELQKQLEKCK
ncbi:MAG: hypothetical protein AAFY41_08730, partial [Bacteroidota bacterium]